jgi:dihydroflavonol-4-reductase
LGNNIARLALKNGIEVAGICRSSSTNQALVGLDMQVYSLDLTDPNALATAFQSRFDAIIHCAAHIHIGWQNRAEATKVNWHGTKNVLAEAKKHDTKVIHVSTVNTLAVGSKDSPADEETQGDGQVPCTYVLTKRAAEQAAVDASEAGQYVVIVHPGFMLGPWDWKPSSGRMIQGLCGFAPISPSGGCTVCDPRDVAQAILNAIELGASGRHYILGGENMTYLELWRKIAKELGKPGPFTYMRAPGRIVSSTVGDLLSQFLGRETAVNSASVGIASQFHWYSSQRAIDELHYQPRPADESIRDAVHWLREHQLIPSTL